MLKNVGTIANFSMWPYGNAQETQYNSTYWYFTCQHGTSECIGNMWEDCAIEHYPTVTQGVPQYWPFVDCLEQSGKAGDATTAQNCAAKNGVDWNVITTCAGSTPQYGTQGDGNPLMHTTAVNTNNLNPPHQWTPWVVLNGVPLTNAQLDMSLTRLVCNAYTGTPPAGCPSVEDTIYERPISSMLSKRSPTMLKEKA